MITKRTKLEERRVAEAKEKKAWETALTETKALLHELSNVTIPSGPKKSSPVLATQLIKMHHDILPSTRWPRIMKKQIKELQESAAVIESEIATQQQVGAQYKTHFPTICGGDMKDESNNVTA